MKHKTGPKPAYWTGNMVKRTPGRGRKRYGAWAYLRTSVVPVEHQHIEKLVANWRQDAIEIRWGNEENMTAFERKLLRDVCVFESFCLLVEQHMLEQKTIFRAPGEPCTALGFYISCKNSAARILEKLGIDKRSTALEPDLKAYLAAKQEERKENEEKGTTDNDDRSGH